MKLIKQEDDLGCAVACVAFVLQINYSDVIKFFIDGETRVREKANFYCPEIVKILNKFGKNYKWSKIKENNTNLIVKNLSIVFIEKSENLPYGHFLARYKDKWMDPWINIPDKNIRAGLRNELPGEATYVIYTK